MSDDRALAVVQPAEVIEREADDLPALDDREAAFVEYYLGVAQFNATKAAQLCGVTSYESAKSIGYRHIHRPRVRAHIDYYLDSLGVNRARILAETIDVAFAPWKDFVEVRGRADGSLDARMDLKSKMDAIKMLGTELGMFNDKLKVDVSFVPKRLVGIGEDDL